MKYLLLAFFLICQLTYATSVKLTTFNIKWFGLGGWPGGSSENEERIPSLKQFWKDHLMDKDVIMFQEIVDTELFVNEVTPEDYRCISYDHKWQKHQHVMICHKDKFIFKKEVGDDNFIIDDVSLWRYRPAISGMLTDQNGNGLLHLIGVHLKAGTDSSLKRISQVEHIAETIEKFEDNLPVIVLGDFNSHISPYNGELEDDTTIFSGILFPLGLNWIKNNFGTYATKWSSRTFDHFWISSDLEIVENLSVFEACNRASDEQGLLNISVYNRQISDHCPTSIGVELSN